MLTKTDLQEIQKIVKHEVRSEIQRENAPINKNIRKIKTDLKIVINFFDREYLQLRARVERLEEHLKLPRLFSN